MENNEIEALALAQNPELADYRLDCIMTRMHITHYGLITAPPDHAFAVFRHNGSVGSPAPMRMVVTVKLP
jgi:hypothetical protein